jgi:hypothetical protein
VWGIVLDDGLFKVLSRLLEHIFMNRESLESANSKSYEAIWGRG